MKFTDSPLHTGALDDADREARGGDVIDLDAERRWRRPMATQEQYGQVLLRELHAALGLMLEDRHPSGPTTGAAA